MKNLKKNFSIKDIIFNQEDTKITRKRSSSAFFNYENSEIPHFRSKDFNELIFFKLSKLDNFDLKQYINEIRTINAKINHDEKEQIDDITLYSIHSFSPMRKFNSKEKKKFQEDITKTIEKEIKRDLLINDINITIIPKPNNNEEKKYSDMMNNIFLDDRILNTNNSYIETKSLDTEERKIDTPKFSPLKFYNIIFIKNLVFYHYRK